MIRFRMLHHHSDLENLEDLRGQKRDCPIKPRIPQPCQWTVLLGQRENRLAQHTRAGC